MEDHRVKVREIAQTVGISTERVQNTYILRKMLHEKIMFAMGAALVDCRSKAYGK